MEKTFTESEFKEVLKQELEKDKRGRPWVFVMTLRSGELMVTTFSNKLNLVWMIFSATSLSRVLATDRYTMPVWFHRDDLDSLTIPPNLFSTKQWKECEKAYADAYEVGRHNVSLFDKKG